MRRDRRVRYNFGSIDHYVFIGGTAALSMILEKAETRKRVSVVTCEWQLKGPSHIHGQNFMDFLTTRGMEFHVFKDIRREPRFRKLVGPRVLGISVSAPWIMRKDTIDLFNGRLINIHGSKLPLYRGGAGMTWQMLQDERRGYYTYHFLAEKIDGGDILKAGSFIYPSSLTCQMDFLSYQRRKIAESFTSFFKMLKDEKDFFPQPQDEFLSTYWPRLNAETHGYINWDWPLEEIEKFINAFSDPFDGAQSFINGERVRIKRAYAKTNEGLFHPFQVGLVYRKTLDAIFAAAKDGALVITSINDDNGQPCLKKIRVGSRIFTPYRYIESAMTTQVEYNWKGLKIKDKGNLK